MSKSDYYMIMAGIFLIAGNQFLDKAPMMAVILYGVSIVHLYWGFTS